jgi:glycine/serine hydroxymethyltransferase
VGIVSTLGQQAFRGQTDVKYVSGHVAALAEARAILAPGRRIFLLDIDFGDWSDVST